MFQNGDLMENTMTPNTMATSVMAMSSVRRLNRQRNQGAMEALQDRITARE
jgi:hypothetical protein